MAGPEDHQLAGDADDKANFDVVRQGFDRDQVRQYVQNVDLHVRRLSADRDEALSQVVELSERLEVAHREIAALTEGRGTTTGQAAPNRQVQVAKVEAAEITGRAQVAAENTWAAAEQASAALRDRYTHLIRELDKQHADIQVEHRAIMDAAHGHVRKMTVEADRRQAEIDERAERERQRIESEFDQTMTTRRADLEREIESRHAASTAQARRTVEEANAKARAAVAEANKRLSDLVAVRNQIADHIRGTREVIEQGSALLEPVENEAEVLASAKPLEHEKPAKNTEKTEKANDKPHSVPQQREARQGAPSTVD
ncbi:hypothetical protein EV193_106238 [Herbihabitans rhizosphaerae]|uniref:DivIVA protein n=1 Tax=Herbihabitans rhizosphaerae TaxID=1872711 RepID=A0A4V2ESB6_9PSEU|nr:hypothetical protein [Herbihabitans rhizosphaerae]RZS37003.1 hypothetical protein EV193_106238 [Herbihabitans rhizosphaerae]